MSSERVSLSCKDNSNVYTKHQVASEEGSDQLWQLFSESFFIGEHGYFHKKTNIHSPPSSPTGYLDHHKRPLFYSCSLGVLWQRISGKYGIFRTSLHSWYILFLLFYFFTYLYFANIFKRLNELILINGPWSAPWRETLQLLCVNRTTSN